MANIDELKNALKETLEEQGVLNKLRAELRAKIFEAIETDDKPKPKLSDENLIINELIRDYLKFNNYYHTASTFIAESGQPEEPPFDNNFIAKELNINQDNNSKQIPLLYSLISGLKQEEYQPINNYNFNSQSINMNNTKNSNQISAKYKEHSMQINNQTNSIYDNDINNTVKFNQNSNTMFNQKDQPKGFVIN